MRIAQTDLRGLMVFRAIVEHDGFTGAQLALGMSQSTISFHLKALEERLGFDLCHRGRGGFRLTQRGRDVYDASKGLIGSVSTFESRLGELRNQVVGTIRLGIVDTTITDPLSPVSKAIGVCMSQEGRPQIEVCVSHPRILAAELEKGGIDIAITPHTEFLGKFESVPLYREHSTLYCGTTHPLFSGKKKLSIKEVAKHDFVIRPYANKKDLTFFKNANVRAYASNMEAQAMFILSGKVVGYLPEHYAKAWVSASEMKPLLSPQTRISSQFLVVMSPSVEPTPLLKMFVSQLRERS